MFQSLIKPTSTVVACARVTVLDGSYTGLGTTKTDAKTNAAANALEALRADGLFAAREQELKAERRGAFSDKQMSAMPNTDSKLLG